MGECDFVYLGRGAGRWREECSGVRGTNSARLFFLCDLRGIWKIIHKRYFLFTDW